jgi:YebC/PmpR family DNA-binding regulatory protein
MAGHSQFKNIMHRKGAQDARKARIFNKIAREITVAAKAGLPDPGDRIDRAIKSGSPGGDDANYEEVRYEGYGPGGIALIVEALTDNRNRTAAEIRSAFAKLGGALGETNSVSFLFNRLGLVTYPARAAGAEAMFEAALEAGADNVESDEEAHEITCAVENFSAVRDALEAAFGPADGARLAWKPLAAVTPDDDTGASLLKLLDQLDDNDDVQTVSGNFDIPEAMLERLSRLAGGA